MKKEFKELRENVKEYCDVYEEYTNARNEFNANLTVEDVEGLAEYFDEEYFRIPETGITSEHEKTFALSKQQQEVYDNLLHSFCLGQSLCCLLSSSRWERVRFIQ